MEPRLKLYSFVNTAVKPQSQFIANCSMKYLGNRRTDQCLILSEDVFVPSLGRVWRLRSKVKCQGHQEQKGIFGPFGGLHAVYDDNPYSPKIHNR